MAAETAVVNPFFVVDKGKKKILIQNIQSAVPCTGSRLPCGNKNMDKITSKYDAPVLNYSHPDDMNYEMSFELVNDLERYRKKYEYIIRLQLYKKSDCFAYLLKDNLVLYRVRKTSIRHGKFQRIFKSRYDLFHFMMKKCSSSFVICMLEYALMYCVLKNI